MASLLRAVRLGHGDDSVDATAHRIDANVKATSDTPVGEPAVFSAILTVVRPILDGGLENILVEGQE
jgi:hypothetical protein